MEPVGQIYSLLPKVMKSIGAVGKDRHAGQDGGPRYAFRGIDDLYNAVQPALVEHGVTCVPHDYTPLERKIVERPNKTPLIITTLSAVFRLYAPDGSFVEARSIGEAMDMSDKGTNKAMSAAMKYALMQSLCIPTEESKDTENEHHELPAREPAQQAAPTPEQLKNAFFMKLKSQATALNVPYKAAFEYFAHKLNPKKTLTFEQIPEATRAKFLAQLQPGAQPSNVGDLTAFAVDWMVRQRGHSAEHAQQAVLTMTEFFDGQGKTFATLDNGDRREVFAGIDAGNLDPVDAGQTN